jgi:hypothetical protein
MTKLRPDDPSPLWKEETVLQRVLTCAAMLHGHQFMSDEERLTVQSRIAKWLDVCSAGRKKIVTELRPGGRGQEGKKIYTHFFAKK